MNSFGHANWSPAEEAVLREKYGSVHAKTLAKRLGRSTLAVMHRAGRIGLVARRRWTADDLQQLRSEWGEHSLGTIARHLKRTVKTTYQKAKELGLELGCPRGLEYLTSAAERIGYDTKSLRRILKAEGVRLLPAFARPCGSKRHYHVVDPQDVDDALARFHAGAPIQQHAREYGISGDCLRFWLLRARDAGLDVPAPPAQKKAIWHVSNVTVAKVIAWREAQETVRSGAKRVGVDPQTLRARLLKAGFLKPPGKTWWVFKADVDRVACGRLP